MNEFYESPFAVDHDHVFLGEGHDTNERKTWGVIALCTVMMVAEIAGGSVFGSLALVADGLHMSTHAGAMLIAAMAYTYARKHASDPRFVFGTGKLGELAGFTSAIILAMIALLIGYEAVVRLLSPVPIQFAEAIPIAAVGLLINIASAWMLSGDDHHGHSHGSGHGHAHDGMQAHEVEHAHEEEVKYIATGSGTLALSVFEDGVPPVFRIHTASSGADLSAPDVSVTTVRTDGKRQVFAFAQRGDFLESTTDIPEPHAFHALLRISHDEHIVVFEEHDHGAHAHGSHEHEVDKRDLNMRAAYMHIIADAAVSVLAIIGLLLAKNFGWLWMDPVAGIVGALVIANWSFGLVRDAGAILMDVNPGGNMASRVRAVVAQADDKLLDLHVWRLGPGHLGAVLSVATNQANRGPAFYHAVLRRFKGLSHITVEVHASQNAA